jgi:hypothetical protein
MPGTRTPPTPLALKTTVAKFGLNARETARLTPGAKRLTKAQLLQLAAGDTSQTGKVTVEDLKSVSQVFGSRAGRLAGADQLAVSVNACCCCHTICCCCCCADAVTDPIA